MNQIENTNTYYRPTLSLKNTISFVSFNTFIVVSKNKFSGPIFGNVSNIVPMSTAPFNLSCVLIPIQCPINISFDGPLNPQQIYLLMYHISPLINMLSDVILDIE